MHIAHTQIKRMVFKARDLFLCRSVPPAAAAALGHNRRVLRLRAPERRLRAGADQRARAPAGGGQQRDVHLKQVGGGARARTCAACSSATCRAYASSPAAPASTAALCARSAAACVADARSDPAPEISLHAVAPACTTFLHQVGFSCMRAVNTTLPLCHSSGQQGPSTS